VGLAFRLAARAGRGGVASLRTRLLAEVAALLKQLFVITESFVWVSLGWIFFFFFFFFFF